MTVRLAIDGGRPVRTGLLPYGRQLVDDADTACVVEALRSGYLTTGRRVEQFEEEFASAVGARYAVAVSSGTAALHAAAAAAGLGPGDEAITTPQTFVATANCVRYQGGIPVFADVRSDILTLDAECVRAAITPKTRAVIAVDYAGTPADLDPLREVCVDHRLVFIEDAAHALGASYKGRRVGSIADLTTFSLHPVKHITTGEGGVVTTGDEEMAGRLRRFRNHGITSDARQRAALASWTYDVPDLGFNYRLTDVQCALGSSQLRKLPVWNDRRRAIAHRYNEAFATMPELQTPIALSDRESAWHLYVIRLRLERLRVDRAAIFAALRAENIGVNVHYIPVPRLSYYAAMPGNAAGQWPNAERAYDEMLSLPLWPGMTDGDAADVIGAVSKVVEAYRK
jgi:perosamine synthetase